MINTRPKLGIILAACLLLNLGGTALAHRVAFRWLCPQPGMTLEAFDVLRAGMSREKVLATLQPKRLFLEKVAACRLGPLVLPGPQVWHFRGDDIDIDLEVVDGVLTDGTATFRGRVIRRHLEPHDAIIDPLRVGLRQLESTVNRYRAMELLCYPVAGVAAIGVVTVIVSAKRARLEPR